MATTDPTYIRINLTALEAKALRTVIFAIMQTTPGEPLKRKLYDYQLEGLQTIAEKVEL